jgi:hypothetical protein
MLRIHVLFDNAIFVGSYPQHRNLFQGIRTKLNSGLFVSFRLELSGGKDLLGHMLQLIHLQTIICKHVDVVKYRFHRPGVLNNFCFIN